MYGCHNSSYLLGIDWAFCRLQQGCSLKEATIVASVLARTKIPVLHASAALIRIAEMDYTGTLQILPSFTPSLTG
jgi:hypothetical protein